mmetsp:Transcript_81079/g.229633  ORF Transcript_81079/g.229633 Transcript_81079/m.229633 type:complete len:248 (+) Transcript_81079:91-834(+)
MPSFASRDPKPLAESSAVHSKASSTGMLGTLYTSDLVADMAPGPPRTSLEAISATLASSRSAGTACVTRPTCAARLPLIFSPESISSAASARRSFGRQTTEMMAGETPMRTSVKPMSQESAMTEMSQAAARPTPPPVQWPLILPRITFGPSCMILNMSTKEYRAASPVFFRFAPAQKVLPLFVRTMIRTSSLTMHAFRLSTKELISSPPKEFFCFGLLRVMVPTPCSTASSVAGSAMGQQAGEGPGA